MRQKKKRRQEGKWGGRGKAEEAARKVKIREKKRGDWESKRTKEN